MCRCYLFLVCLYFSFAALSLNALPSQILIMRHAEKVHGGIDLDLKGQERAFALVPYFLGTTKFLGKPSIIYAARATKEHASLRPYQTVAPLAKELNIKINQDFDPKQYAALVESIKMNAGYNNQVVLICWEHSVIPEIARLLGATSAPKAWSSDVFDRVWIVTFIPGGKVNFENVPQQLMYGDASR